MKFLQMMVAATLFCLALGCANRDSKDSGREDSNKNENVTETHTINGKPAQAYYEQFLYKKETTGVAPYRYLMSSDILLGEDGEFTRYGRMNLFLLENERFILKYSEQLGQKTEIGTSYQESDVEKTFEGTWRVDELTLIIEGQGKGAGIEINGDDRVGFTFDHSISAPALKGKFIYLAFGYSNIGLQQ